MRFVASRANEPAIAFDTAGEHGPPILLIMGFGMRGSLWKPQIEGLRDDHQLAFFDNRGVGKSGPARGCWTMATMAHDALSVADELGWTRFHVVGVSMGGMIAQELALRAPLRVRSLSLIATHPGGHPIRYAPTARGLRLFARAQRRNSDRVQAVRELLYPPAFLAECDRDALDERMAEQLGKPAPRPTVLGQLSAIARHRTGPRLRRLSMPTLIVKPSLDVLVPPRASDDLKRHIPNAQVLTLKDAGHGAIFQCATQVNTALRQHVHESEMIALSASAGLVHA